MRIPTMSMYQQQLATITKQYDNLNRLYGQCTSEKKLLQSSDDPVLASQIKSTQEGLQNIQTYSESALLAQNRASLLESSSQAAINLVQRINELVSRAKTDTQSDEGRAAMGLEVQGYLETLLNISNTQDGSGQYIFSGFNTDTPAYILQGSNYTYQGSYNPSTITVSNNNNFTYTEAGHDIFGKIYNSNGNFTITSNASNTGAAYTAAGNVTNITDYVEDNYILSFVVNSSGKTGYQIVGSTSGQVIPAPPATSPADAPEYIPGTTIHFNGINFSIMGAPNTGDQFDIKPSTTNNVFNTLKALVTTLKTPTNNDATLKANFHQSINQLDASLNQISNHLINYQAELGTRMSLIDTQIRTDDTTAFNQTMILNHLANIDFVETYSSLQQQLAGLEATQMTYSKIQEVVLRLLRG